jgi:ABC-type glycerol-3-phosphate transport system substrate-binding protein
MGCSRAWGFAGRRRLRGWQLGAMAVSAGALAVAGCSSSSSSGSSAVPSASGSATGTIVWSASPIAGSGSTDTRTVLINAFE